MGNDGHNHTPGNRRRPVQVMAPPKQVNLQFLDDTWERLLNAVERLEQVTEGFKNLTATRLDRHVDRDEITEPELDVRMEVHLQIKSLERVIHHVRADGQWMIGDFLRWYGGRTGRNLAPTDEYAVPVLLCILGERYTLPNLDEVVPTKRDILGAAEALGQGLHEADNIEEKFTANPDLEATKHSHDRARTPASGLVRLAGLKPALAVHLARQIDYPPAPANGRQQ